MVSSASMMAGASTDHVLVATVARFSAIMRPQLAAGGLAPKPRKLTLAARMITPEKRTPTSAMIAGAMLGRTSRRMIAVVRSPRATAASM